MANEGNTAEEILVERCRNLLLDDLTQAQRDATALAAMRERQLQRALRRTLQNPSITGANNNSSESSAILVGGETSSLKFR